MNCVADLKSFAIRDTLRPKHGKFLMFRIFWVAYGCHNVVLMLAYSLTVRLRIICTLLLCEHDMNR